MVWYGVTSRSPSGLWPEAVAIIQPRADQNRDGPCSPHLLNTTVDRTEN